MRSVVRSTSNAVRICTKSTNQSIRSALFHHQHINHVRQISTEASNSQTIIQPASNNQSLDQSIEYRWAPSSSSPAFTLISALSAQLQSIDQSTNQSLNHPVFDQEIGVRGWLRSVRVSKNVAFIMVNDGSIIHSLQCVITRDQAKMVSNGACVSVRGKLVRIEKKVDPSNTQPINQPIKLSDIELQVTDLQLVGACPSTYPIAKTKLTLEYLRDHQHLRMRTNTLSAVMRIRSTVHQSINQWMQSHDFWLVQTPIITPLDCEGGGEAFSVSAPSDKPAPTINQSTNQPINQSESQTMNQINSQSTKQSANQSNKKSANQSNNHPTFFGRKAYLGVSGQLYAEMAALALTRVFTFGPTFRAETSVTPRHLAEFWMLEPEMAFASLTDVCDVAEQLIKHCIDVLMKRHPDDLEFLNTRVDKELLARLQSTLAEPFARMTYTQAIEALQASQREFEFPVAWGESLSSEHEKWLAEEHCKKPVFVTNYPRAIKPFYMRVDDASLLTPGRETVACVDLLVPAVGELIGGSEREDRLDILDENFSKAGLIPADYSWYRDLRQYGSAPHAGFGLGFERLLRYVTGIGNVRDLIPVPRGPGNLNF